MGKEVLSQKFMALHTDSKRRPAAGGGPVAGTALTHMWGRTQGERAGGQTGRYGGGMGWGTMLLSLLENRNTTYFSNCCLFALESMGIINELPIKKNYMWGKGGARAGSGSRVEG